jgi:predicted DNA-binding transcriptional regulator AlpA
MTRLLDAHDVAEMLGVKVAWVWAKTRSGEIPYVPLGRYKKYRVEAIQAWLEELERAAA